MGFSISGLLKDVGINLPNIDLGNIGSTVLNEGKQLLGDVVKDSFTLSNQPGQTFASDMNLNVLGDNVRLPNPIGSLANSLLGGADAELNKIGVNVDFKKVLGGLFNLPTEAGTTTTVPPLATRAAAGQVPGLVPQAAVTSTAAGAAATGGGVVTSSAATSGAAGANATGGASPTVAPTVSGASALSSSGSADAGLVSALGSEDDSLNGLINSISDTMSPADLAKVQAKIAQAQEMVNTLSNILKDEHDMRMAMINNIRS